MAARVFRTATVLTAIAVIVSLLFSTMVLSVGAGRSAELASKRLGADMVVLPPIIDRVQSYGYATETLNRAPVSQSHISGSAQYQIANISGIAEVSPQLYVGRLNSSGRSSIDLIAFDQTTDFTVLPWTSEQSKIQLGAKDALAGYSTGLGVGDVVVWQGLGLNVVGVLEKSDTSLDAAVFFPLQSYGGGSANSVGGQASALLIRLKPNHPPEIVGKQVFDRIFPSKVVVARDIEREVGAQVGALTTFELLQGGVVGVGFLLVVGFLFSVSTNEKRRQLGLLRALGGTRGFVARIVVVEAVLTASVGTALGLVTGSSLAYLGAESLVRVFGLPTLQPSLLEIFPLVAESALIGGSLGVAAALYPAYIAGRLEPYEAIRGGD